MRQNKFPCIEIPLNGFASGQDRVVLALGPESKANYCIITGAKAFLHYGFDDLKKPDNYAAYRKHLLKEIKKLKTKPCYLAHDLNPVFLSSRLANELHESLLPKAVLVPVQHHSAHVAAARAAAGLREKIILGVACDGTGLGDDGRVWGCEFILDDAGSFKRAGHLAYIALPGADKAVQQPWRTGVSLLYRAYGKKIFFLKVPCLEKKRYELPIVLKMIERGVNTPLASSAGRLFDGIASIIGICQQADTEAQAAILMEKAARKAVAREQGKYRYQIREDHGMIIADINALVKDVVADVLAKEKKEIIAARFHHTFSDIIITVCRRIGRKIAVNDIVLTGGVFFNTIVRQRVQEGLRQYGFTVHNVPEMVLGDGGLSLGQAVIAYVSGNTGKN